MISRPDLLDARSPAGLEIFQITSEAIPSCHVYMEAQIFTPDSKRLVIHRSAHVHGSDRHDPEHRYLLVDAQAGPGKPGDQPIPLTTETGPTCPAIAPDGKYFYYLLDQTQTNAGRLTLKRVKLDGTGRETILVVDSPLPGAKARLSKIYPLSTISSDGKRLATAAYLGDGRTNFGPWGLVVFDIEKATADVVLAGQSWCNLHPQYCRSTDAEASHDILVQENHDNVCDATGQYTKLCGSQADGSQGADIHVIRDDGSNFRNLPWGRDGKEYCQGHQCWRGRSTTAITTAGQTDLRFDIPTSAIAGGAPGTLKVHEEHLIEGEPVPYDGHRGRSTAGGRRNVLSRSFEQPRFFHFATDAAGQRFISDHNPRPGRGCDLYVATLGRPMQDPMQNWTYLLDTRTDFGHAKHPHPFLSPDGKLAFFNSDESGVLQAYMARGF